MLRRPEPGDRDLRAVQRVGASSRFVARLVPLLLVCSLLAGGGCSGPKSGGGAAPDGEKVLYVYNWVDFIGKSTIANFEKETGIRVVYDTFDADSTLEAKLMAGDSGYDVVATALDYYSRQIKAGAYEKLDRSQLTNWHFLDPQLLKTIEVGDPGNQYAVPYLNSLNGFIYNEDMIRARMPDAPRDSLRMIFDPAVISRFADCGVSLLDSAEDVIQLALAYLGRDPNSRNPADLHDAEELVVKIRPYVRTFDSSEFLSTVTSGEMCLVMAWSSDYSTAKARARAAGREINLRFTVPREGSNFSVTSLLIPAGAPHRAAAHKFLNYMLRPEVIAQVTNDTHYSNPNLAATKLVDPSILNDPAMYPTPEVMKRTYTANEASVEFERVRTRMWTRIKTNH
jgi:putrescine transport system substrate-binding protein